MGLYPVNLELSGRLCLIAGGGGVAQRKAGALLRTGACVRIISPEATDRIVGWHCSGALDWQQRLWQEGDARGAFLLFAATDDRSANSAIAQEGRQAGALVNCADYLPDCDFTLPAQVRRGDLLFTVSTGGTSPAVAKILRQELENKYGPEYEALLAFVADLRRPLQERLETSQDREECWRKLLTREILDLVAQGREQEAEESIAHAISSVRSES